MGYYVPCFLNVVALTLVISLAVYETQCPETRYNYTLHGCGSLKAVIASLGAVIALQSFIAAITNLKWCRPNSNAKNRSFLGVCCCLTYVDGADEEANEKGYAVVALSVKDEDDKKQNSV